MHQKGILPYVGNVLCAKIIYLRGNLSAKRAKGDKQNITHANYTGKAKLKSNYPIIDENPLKVRRAAWTDANKEYFCF